MRADALIASAKLVAGILIPRFESDTVALRYMGYAPRGDWAGYDIACSLENAVPGEKYDGIATVDCFTWLGFGVAYAVRGFRAWPASGVFRG